jgi:GNAT superfamily N-acetyltransferase
MIAEWSDLAERTEAIFMARFNVETDPETRAALGMEARPLGGHAVMTLIRRDPMRGYWNKALGFTEPVTDDELAEIVAMVERAEVPTFGVQVQPRCQADGFTQAAERLGLQLGATFVKCFGPAAPREVDTDGLRIERLTADDAAVFSRIMHVGFGVERTDLSERWLADPAFFDGDWVTYAAYEGDEPVAVARLLVVAETQAAALCGAATLPEARGRGAQSALLDVRIRDARDRGCRWASAETWAETLENPNPSQHNMRSAGLTEVHVRRNWVYRSGTA